MKALANLLVVFGADTSKVQKELKKTEREFEKTSQKIGSFGKMMTAAVTVPIAAAAIGVTKLAMNAVESENLFTTSMGDMAGSARKWSEQLRQDLGLNAFEVRKNVGMFYAMFESMKIGSQDAYKLSTGLTQLAYDMESFYNIPIEQAFEKLRSGITGEIEPLKALGILVNETTVKTYAYTHGIAAQGTELTEQQKVMARYGAIMEQTSKAQGDLARTADSPLNQLRRMRNEVTQLAIEMGTALLPATESLIDSAKPLVGQVKNIVNGFVAMDQEQKNAIIKMVALVAAIGPLALGLSAVTKVAGVFTGGLRTLINVVQAATKAKAGLAAGTMGVRGAMLLLSGGPVGLVIAGLTALAGIAAFAALKMGSLKKATQDTWAVMGSRDADERGEAISSAFSKFAKSAEDTWGPLKKTEEAISHTSKELVNEKLAMKKVQKETKAATETTKEFGDYSSAAGGKAAKAAEDTRTAWEKTSDKIASAISRIDKEFQIWLLTEGKTATETQKLQKEKEILNSKLNQEAELVNAAYAEWQKLSSTLTENADATLEAKDRWMDARIALLETGSAVEELDKKMGVLYDQFSRIPEWTAEQAQGAFNYIKKGLEAGKSLTVADHNLYGNIPEPGEGKTTHENQVKRLNTIRKQMQTEFNVQKWLESELAPIKGSDTNMSRQLENQLQKSRETYLHMTETFKEVSAVVEAGHRKGVPDLTIAENWQSALADLPALAGGGYITRPVLMTDIATGRPAGIAGEAGTEAVVPVSGGARAGASGLTVVFQGPVYGMLDFEQKIKSIVRDAAMGGAFRGVLTRG